jgi:hypothetical protein
MQTFDEFIELVKQRPIPNNSIAKIRTFAKELAEGATLGFWSSIIPIHEAYSKNDIIDYEISLKVYLSIEIPTIFTEKYRLEPIQLERILRYYDFKWSSTPVSFDLLRSNNFISINNGGMEITAEAFALLSDSDPSTIFISYKRSESSAFALLVLARLKEFNLEPFIDMSLIAGEDWHEGLESRIKERDYFIVLLGTNTLESTVTVKEISWAIKYGKTIIPVWHNHFEFKSDEWSDIPEDVAMAIGRKHAIKVFDESALGYNTAIVELLNQFGITP